MILSSLPGLQWLRLVLQNLFTCVCARAVFLLVKRAHTFMKLARLESE